MKLLALLALFALAKAKVTSDKQCDGVIVRGVNHEKEVLMRNIDRPYQLAIDYVTNTLFFSYYEYTGYEIFQSAYMDLKNNEFGMITGILGGLANAVDDLNHTVYLGGREGIYKFDFNTKTAVDLNITSVKNIWQLFFNRVLYFTNYPREEAYVYQSGNVSRVPELRDTRAMLVAVDNDQNIFFSNSSGLFCHQSDTKTIINIGKYSIVAMTIDNHGNLYFATPSSLYMINHRLRQIELMLTVKEYENVYGMAIEGDGNIIYASMIKLIRLKSTGHRCSESTSVAGYAGDNTL